MRDQNTGQEQDFYTGRSNDLSPTGQLPGWHLKQGPDIKGWPLIDRDGNNIGEVKDVLVDRHSGEGIFAIVEHRIAGAAKYLLLPVDRLGMDADNRRIAYSSPQDYLKNAPEYRVGTRDFGQYYDYWLGKKQAEEAPAVAEHEHEHEHAPMATEADREMAEGPEAEKIAGRAGGQATAEPETTGKVEEVIETTTTRIYRKPAAPEAEAQPEQQGTVQGETAPPAAEQQPTGQQAVVKKPETAGESTMAPGAVDARNRAGRFIVGEKAKAQPRAKADVEKEQKEEDIPPPQF